MATVAALPVGQPEFITYRVEDKVAWVMLNRPEASNAQNYRLLDQLDAAFRRAVDDDEVKVIVLGGEGKHFSAGHDLGTPEKDTHLERARKSLWWDHRDRPGAERQYVLEQDAYLGLCRRWQDIPKPMIAMVQGACIAGGLMLAWVCDLIVASEDAFFQDPVVRMGVPGVEYFAHAFELPPRVARELLLLGERMPASRAYQFGMVNRIFPRDTLRAEVAKMAAEIATRDRLGLALTRQAINMVEDLRGKRQAMDAHFHMHHFAHAQNQLVTGSLVGGLDAKAMAKANKGGAWMPVLDGLPATLRAAADAAQAFTDALRPKVAARIAGADGKPDRKAADREQHIVHGFGWVATYAEVMREVAGWAARLDAEGAFGETEALLAQLLVAEYGAQLSGGIAMNQGETIRAAQLGATAGDLALLDVPALAALIEHGATQAVKTAIAAHLVDAQGRATLENTGLDPLFDMVRDQFFAFARDKVSPHAHDWHLADELIPAELVAELGALGVFGMTIPEAHGGLGMGKTAMCVVSEELSRGWIGVGSLATRSEIAAELILCGGTAEQKAHWLPRIASAEILPTAVFTEPDTGSDLGALRTRATRDADSYSVSGNKTWITHAARADLMTLLVRTDPETKNYSGLSMLLAPKQRGTVADPFPTPGMSGGEIEVIGYRGMKEYEIGFDAFRVPAANLLGGVEGQGFKQLMATFESARIQTAARAVGVAQAALDVGLSYALGRKQFGRAIIDFPRVANKLAMMAAEIMGARQLTYFAARRKDEDKRCDLEAGMAKLIGARVAWAAADNALQIHGGNGFATEYPVSRLLADARILNIFEGAGEIQAQVIARRLLDGGN